MRRRVVLPVVFALLSGFVWTAAAVARGEVAPEPEAAFEGRIGDERTAASLGGLVVSDELVAIARRHAQEMADQQNLHHNESLATDVPNWQKVGENVGVGPSVEEIHQKFMGSSAHRENILDKDFTEVGVGVVVDGPDLWVVEVFRLPKPAPAPAPAATQPAPSNGETDGGAAAGGESSGAGGGSAESSGVRSGGGGASSSGGGVRAASSGGPSRAPSTTPSTSATAPATTVVAAPTTTTVPATNDEFDAPAFPATATPSTVRPAPTTTVAEARAVRRPVVATVQPPRDVTTPIGAAAALLVLVVSGLVWQVASERARLAAGSRRPSVVDVWELALAA